MKKTTILLLFACPIGLVFGQKQNFDAVFEHFRSAKNFNGVALVATGGQVDYLNAGGLAHRETGAAITVDSRFKLCSITKTFTAAIILQLMEAGKIDLNATIGQYLPEYRGPARDRSTIANLLTYSSGLDNLDQQSDAMYQSKWPVDSLVSRFCSGSLVAGPGEQFSYKNADFILLGKIIERVTGFSFEKNLRDRILSPLGMANSGMLRNDLVVPGMVSSYVCDSTGVFGREDPFWIENFYAAGAMFSTIGDLLKFDHALFSAQLFSQKTLDLMLVPHPELWGVAIGFWVSPTDFGAVKSTVADRRGSIGGTNTNWLHLREQHKTILIFSNTDATDLVEMREQLALSALGQAVFLKK